MQRRDFLLTSCRACAALLAAPAIASTLEGCSSSKALANFTEADGQVRLPASALAGKPSVVIKPKSLVDPLLVVKQPDGSYKALLMKCPHKGGPLNDVGGTITCDWHGSTFDSTGNVTKGPAKQGLTSYPVSEEAGQLVIAVG